MDDPTFAPDLEPLRALLLALASEREVSPLLEGVVRHLADTPDVALARIWLLHPDRDCPTCHADEGAALDVPSLHLVASAGTPHAALEADWSRTDGDFHRVPIGERKVGSVAASAAPVWVEDVRENDRWIARPDWARREGIRGFGGQPLAHHGEVLGVLGLFTRRRFGREALDSLRLLADHAAAAIANARAFEETARLRRQLELENESLREEVREAHASGEILGDSPAMRQLQEQIEQVAPTDATVLVLGETGTGKELVSRAIHHRSARAKQALIRVNCASVPAELYESEFFGHVKGAFTGAVRDRVGRFAAAEGGTLLLDEVGEIPLALQAKLLRVLQEGQYERLGDPRTVQADVRVVAATNRDLEREVAEGRFREDLFYRLHVFPIRVPPLRDRKEDVPRLAEAFLARANRKHERSARLRPADLRALQQHDWPGNVRELQNVIERAVLGARDGRLPLPLGATAGPRPGRTRILSEAEMREFERSNLEAALEACGGKIYGPDGVAERLGLRPTTVASRLRRLGLGGAR